MRIDEYTDLARRTANRDAVDPELHYAFMVAAEAGEVAALYQKRFGYRRELTREQVIDECGDVFWALVMLLDSWGIDASECLEYNIAKLRKRYPGKFTVKHANEQADKRL